jgi:protein phosphatase
MESSYCHLKWSGKTDRGKVRKNNEDAFVALRLTELEVQLLGKIGESPLRSDPFVFAVSDGMGGAMAGEYASRIAIDKITRLLPRWQAMPQTDYTQQLPQRLTGLFTEIHRALRYLGLSYEECRGMEATLSLGMFVGERFFFAHIGDSRIYHLRKLGGELRQLTEDDTHVGWLLRQGHINEREARSHPRRHILQKALGGNNQFVSPQVGSVHCSEGDRFLFCTDGVTEELYDRDMAELLLRVPRPDENTAESLVESVLERGARDNTTALVVDWLGLAGTDGPGVDPQTSAIRS